MKPHKHAELIKAWADGAEIEFRQSFHVAGPGGGTCFTDWKRKLHDSWHEHIQYRIKPQEVPQWRKDMAQALEDGKVVEFNVNPASPYGWIVATKTDLEDERIMGFGQEHFRIKPEPKPDFYTLDRIYLCDDGDWVATDCEPANIKLTFDGETRKLKDAEVLC